jgi:hypothetical protein
VRVVGPNPKETEIDGDDGKRWLRRIAKDFLHGWSDRIYVSRIDGSEHGFVPARRLEQDGHLARSTELLGLIIGRAPLNPDFATGGSFAGDIRDGSKSGRGLSKRAYTCS